MNNEELWRELAIRADERLTRIAVAMEKIASWLEALEADNGHVRRGK